ncbi:unnamed protein product [Victoria cruziana]
MVAGAKLVLLLLLLPFVVSTLVPAEQRPHHMQAEEDEDGMEVGAEAIGWLSSEMEEMIGVADDEFPLGGEMGSRRSLFWRTLRHYYISYGALSANRVPCPPRSGRSYYTHNCYRATGPVRPYRRGCASITRCSRA